MKKGLIDELNDDIKVMLVDGSYTPDKDAHTKRSDITGEITGTGYTAGGKSLTTKTVTQDNTNDLGVLDADDLSWAAATIAADGAVLYKARGGLASADELIGYVDFGGTITSTAGAFTITWHAAGILVLG